MNSGQPEILQISEELRLRTTRKEEWSTALPWYQNPKVLYYSEGTDQPYDMDVITRMYGYLSEIGELYFIEILQDKTWLPIGDVTLSPETMPIVIGHEAYWGKGIGRKVILRLLDRARALGYRKIKLKTIYPYNMRSQNMFEAAGFVKIGEDQQGCRYEIDLTVFSQCPS